MLKISFTVTRNTIEGINEPIFDDIFIEAKLESFKTSFLERLIINCDTLTLITS